MLPDSDSYLCVWNKVKFTWIIKKSYSKYYVLGFKYQCRCLELTDYHCALWWEATASPSEERPACGGHPEPCRAALPPTWHPKESTQPWTEWRARAPDWEGPERGWPSNRGLWRKPCKKESGKTCLAKLTYFLRGFYFTYLLHNYFLAPLEDIFSSFGYYCPILAVPDWFVSVSLSADE